MIIQLRIHCCAWRWRWCRAVSRDAMPMPLPMPLYNDVSLPPRKHAGVQVRIPPGGAGVGGGGGMALRACGTPIYILIYILHIIS